MLGLEIRTSKPQIHEARRHLRRMLRQAREAGQGPLTMQNEMIEKPQLVTKPWNIGEPFIYKCSQRGQEFLPPEDRNSDEAIAEVRAAFHEHVREVHGEDRG
jgi:hypothetical protein